MSTLGKSEKIQLINSRINGLEFKKYALELDLIVENSKTSPDVDATDVIDTSIAEIDGQLAAINAELATVNSLPE